MYDKTQNGSKTDTSGSRKIPCCATGNDMLRNRKRKRNKGSRKNDDEQFGARKYLTKQINGEPRKKIKKLGPSPRNRDNDLGANYCTEIYSLRVHTGDYCVGIFSELQNDFQANLKLRTYADAI